MAIKITTPELRNRPFAGPLNEKTLHRFFLMQSLECDCNLDRRWVDELKERICAGLGRPFDWACVYIRGQSFPYRLNGKHSSCAVKELFMAGKLDLSSANLQVVVTEFVVDNMNDALALYRQYDDAQSSRSTPDVLRSLVCGDGRLRGIPERILKAAMAAVSQTVLGKSAAARLSLEKKLNLVQKEYSGFIQTAAQLCAFNSKLFRRVAVVRAMFLIWRDSDAEYSDLLRFWEEVADTTIPSGRKIPTGALTYFLDSKEVSVGRGAGTKHSVTESAMTQACIQAWNAWRQGRNTVRFLLDGEEMPAII